MSQEGYFFSARSYASCRLLTHAGIAAGVGIAFRRVCLSVCVCVCVCLSVCVSLLVRAVKRKRLELSTPHLVHIYLIAVARHALTHRSKGQRSRSHGYVNCHGARLLVTMAGIP